MADRREENHQERILRKARDGVNRIIYDKVRYNNVSSDVWETLKALAQNRDSIADQVVNAIREDFTIRPRVRK